MTSGRASREERRQKVTDRRLQVARAEATRQALRVSTVVLLLLAAAGAAAWFLLT